MKSLSRFTIFFVATIAFADQPTPPTPAEQFAQLRREYRPASYGLRDVKNDLERKAAVERMGSFAPRFIEFAEEHPADPIVFEVLRQATQIVGSTDSGALTSWEISRSEFPSGSNEDCAGRIVSLLQRHHLRSDELAPVIDRMRYGYRLEFAEFLEVVLKKNPHREIRGIACISLALNLNDRLQMLHLLESRADLEDCYQTVFGDRYVSDLKKLEKSNLPGRIENLFELANKEFADVKLPYGTVGEIAESGLYELRNLGIGKTAPDIAGKDQSGIDIKLSGYRGKIVLLYFWSQY